MRRRCWTATAAARCGCTWTGNASPRKTPAYCPPILFDEEQMGIVIGHIAPWYLGKDGYRGLIDEVRVSASVRPAYAVAADSPPPAGACLGATARCPPSTERCPARR